MLLRQHLVDERSDQHQPRREIRRPNVFDFVLLGEHENFVASEGDVAIGRRAEIISEGLDKIGGPRILPRIGLLARVAVRLLSTTPLRIVAVCEKIRFAHVPRTQSRIIVERRDPTGGPGCYQQTLAEKAFQVFSAFAFSRCTPRPTS